MPSASLSSQGADIVVDASALVELIAADLERTKQLASAIGASPMSAPDVVNLEIASALRGLERGGKLGADEADRALARFLAAPLERVPTLGLLIDCWRLRAHLSVYDAAYVALARMRGCALLTCDARLASAAGIDVPVIVV